jgi:hypothetical protein
MFDQLSKPLLGGLASKNAIQMVWGALLCKIGVDTGILIDVQSSRTRRRTQKKVVITGGMLFAPGAKSRSTLQTTSRVIEHVVLGVCLCEICMNMGFR